MNTMEVDKCFFCESTEVIDRGTYIDEENGLAFHQFECRRCGGRWQYNGTLTINWDVSPQINRDPNMTSNEAS